MPKVIVLSNKQLLSADVSTGTFKKMREVAQFFGLSEWGMYAYAFMNAIEKQEDPNEENVTDFLKGLHFCRLNGSMIYLPKECRDVG